MKTATSDGDNETVPVPGSGERTEPAPACPGRRPAGQSAGGGQGGDFGGGAEAGTRGARAPRAEEPVPLFGTWRWAYAVVVIALALNVALLYAVTRWVS